MLMTWCILMLTVELQLCLVVAVALPKLRHALKPIPVRCDQRDPVARARGGRPSGTEWIIF
jgi:hypothetical protein